MITPRIAKHSADRDARKKVVMAALHNLGIDSFEVDSVVYFHCYCAMIIIDQTFPCMVI